MGSERSPISELRSLFDEILEENRQVLHRKKDALLAEGEVSAAMSNVLTMLLDEIGYIKTEQTFERIIDGGGAVAVPPILGKMPKQGRENASQSSRALEVDLSGFFRGECWHDVEWNSDNGTGYRWSDGQTGWVEARINRGVPLTIRFECLSIFPNSKYEDISIVVGNKTLETERLVDPLGVYTIFAAALPPAPERSGQIHRIGISCSTAGRPSDFDIDSMDDRVIGVAAVFFRIYPDDQKGLQALASGRSQVS